MINKKYFLIYWSPRILGILFTIFIALFALDAFGEGRGFFWGLFAFLMHLIPALMVAGILVLSWKREWIGGTLFIGLAIYYMLWAWGRFDALALILISGPLFLTGVLFVINWIYREKVHGNSHHSH